MRVGWEADLLEHQRDLELVLVLQDDGVRRLEGVRRAELADEQHEAGELARAGAEREGLRGARPVGQLAPRRTGVFG